MTPKPATPRLGIVDSRLHWAGGSIRLEPMEAQMLGLIVNGQGRTVSYETLESGLWPHEQDLPGDPRNVIKVRLCHLRKRLAAAGLAGQIVTVPKVGFRFIGRIEVDWSDAL